MQMKPAEQSRREFLVITLAGTGLAVSLASCTDNHAHFSASPYFSIDTDGLVIVSIPRTEIGQGVMTGLAQLIAEELGVMWSQIDVVHAPADRARFGHEQVTVASQSLYDSWKTWREAAATARKMMEIAAARTWRVSPAECAGSAGEVRHAGTDRTIPYGRLTTLASRVPIPPAPVLKTTFEVIGKSLPRKDSIAKCTGRALYGIDTRLRGLLTAVVLHAPRYGESVATVDGGAAIGPGGRERMIVIPRQVFQVDQRNYDLRGGVAVIADDYWTAYVAAARLKITWTRTRPTPSNDDITAALVDALDRQKPLANTGEQGSGKEPLKSARYTAPFLAHATMEPMNCTASVDGETCRVWAPSQAPLSAQAVAAAVSGLPLSAVTVQTPFIGGGFGRRTEVDYVAEAVFLAKAMRRPVKVIWPREEDMRQDYFRPAAIMDLAGGCRGKRITRWSSKLAAGSSTAARRGGELDPDLIDWTLVLGAHANPYAPEHFNSSFAIVELGPPTGYMRGVSNGYTCFANESFVDELAEQAGVNPVVFRLANLDHDPRAFAVVKRAADLVRWNEPMAAGRHRGLALLRESRGDRPDDYNLCVATVVEIEAGEAKPAAVRKVTVVGDFGKIVNPDLVKAQMQGGIIFGLSAALKGRIDFVDGEPQQTNFDCYEVIRMTEAPEIEVDLIDSSARPGGVGEKGVPGVAPALANALYRATGHRQRALPLSLG